LYENIISKTDAYISKVSYHAASQCPGVATISKVGRQVGIICGLESRNR